MKIKRILRSEYKGIEFPENLLQVLLDLKDAITIQYNSLFQEYTNINENKSLSSHLFVSYRDFIIIGLIANDYDKDYLIEISYQDDSLENNLNTTLRQHFNLYLISELISNAKNSIDNKCFAFSQLIKGICTGRMVNSEILSLLQENILLEDDPKFIESLLLSLLSLNYILPLRPDLDKIRNSNKNENIQIALSLIDIELEDLLKRKKLKQK